MSKHPKAIPTASPSNEAILLSPTISTPIPEYAPDGSDAKLSRARHGSVVTLQDIADQCRVSRMTVSRALRGDRRFVSEATAARIRETAEQLGYDAARFEGARRLVLGSHDIDVLNHAVALFFPKFSLPLPYFIRIFSGMITAFTALEFSLVTNLLVAEDVSSSSLLPRIIRRGDVDGALVYCTPEHFMPMLSALREEPHFQHRPIVSLINPLPGCSVIETEDRSGAFQAMTHLLALGHRRVLHCYGPWDTTPAHQQRAAGIRQACEAAGVNPAEAIRITFWDFDDQATTMQRMLSILEEDHGITALMAPNDRAAILFWHAATAQGLRIPEDVSLIGHDDSDELPLLNEKNILTTIHLPLEEMGRLAAELLVQQILEQTSDITTLMLPVTLTLRATTAPPRA